MIHDIQTILGNATAALDYSRLGLSPIALDLGTWHIGGHELHPMIRWYSLAYIAGILVGWWYLLKLLATPGAPMARRHADDLVFYATLGILLGGRTGYVLFYRPQFFAEHPGEIVKLWDGGMSLHGGLLGTLLAIFLFTRRNRLSFLRVCDYVACCAPFGLFFGRLANFVNGELWGRPTSLPWGMVFPDAGSEPRHPSQLYEAGIEGLFLFALLWVLFWRSDARYQPGKLVGTGLIVYGLSRFLLELVRAPDAGLEHLSWGLTMGQTLSTPMVLIGAYLVATAKGRRTRVEPIAGGASVA